MLLACPFCREMFEPGEVDVCPECDVAVVALSKLPPSYEVAAEETPKAPEEVPLSWFDVRRGRGLLFAFAVVGLAVFFAPWIRVTFPDPLSLSGFQLARRLGWCWAPAAAWFVLVPTVLSRRTVSTMRSARVAAAFLAAIPGMSALVFLVFPPRAGLVRTEYEFALGLFLTLLTSVSATLVAMFFGGPRALAIATESEPPIEKIRRNLH